MLGMFLVRALLARLSPGPASNTLYIWSQQAPHDIFLTLDGTKKASGLLFRDDFVTQINQHTRDDVHFQDTNDFYVQYTELSYAAFTSLRETADERNFERGSDWNDIGNSLFLKTTTTAAWRSLNTKTFEPMTGGEQISLIGKFFYSYYK